MADEGAGDRWLTGKHGRTAVIALIMLLPGVGDRSSAAPGATTDYRDDTFALASSGVVVRLPANQGAKPYYLPRKKAPGRTILDLRGERLFLNNSKNADPTPGLRCDQGPLPITSYPINIFSADDVVVMGGLIEGSVPQASDWDSSYCNSAAINFKNSANGVVDGVRVSRAWDGVRVGPRSGNLMIRNSWLSEMRDDAIENDNLLATSIEDSLIDGALQGVALRPNAKSKIRAAEGDVRISGSLIRLQEYPYKGRRSLGSLVKADPRSSRVTIVNSVVAIDSPTDESAAGSWAIMRSKWGDSSNNLLLWLSDRPMPADLVLPPSGFRLLKGAEARAAWVAARTNWINCHPKLARLATDTKSDAKRCRARAWGGYGV